MGVGVNIYGLDPSLSCTALSHPDWVSPLLIKSKHRGVERLIQIRDSVLLAMHDTAAVVVIEGYSHGSKFATHVAGELGGVLRVALHEFGARFVDVQPTTLKKFAVGKGNATKDEVLAAAVKAGANVTGNDAADAWWLMQMGLLQEWRVVRDLDDPRVPFMAYRREALDKVEWPSALTKEEQ